MGSASFSVSCCVDVGIQCPLQDVLLIQERVTSRRPVDLRILGLDGVLASMLRRYGEILGWHYTVEEGAEVGDAIHVAGK